MKIYRIADNKLIFAGIGLPSIKKRDAVEFLMSRGFSLQRSQGSHEMWRNPEGVTAVLATHGNKVNPNGFAKMLKQIGVSVSEFNAYWRSK